jgi:hypothetical protein
MKVLSINIKVITKKAIRNIGIGKKIKMLKIKVFNQKK